MLTLAVDTTANFGSIALADANGVREEVLVHAPRGFSHVLFGEMEAMLARQRVVLADIELFAGASGPGSFTGVRVGLSAIKGLAEVLGKPVVAISNLEALAAFGTSDARATIIDAQRGEIYAALYDGAGRQVVAESVLPVERFLGLLPKCEMEWISQDFEPFLPLLGGARFAGYPVITAPRALAAVIARIAIQKAREGLARDPAAIEANYVRRSDAELLFKGN
ncbi:MAG TPA: tRNA (adenosine(37)-N6)-threonylcarbamoyltransferase complex dimerization subunit type 1 TsaB [Bryobacteraceae bacterium]|jgi:tRNA threonylcarbamoyladenosine biosynthesis protein TsaB